MYLIYLILFSTFLFKIYILGVFTYQKYPSDCLVHHIKIAHIENSRLCNCADDSTLYASRESLSIYKTLKLSFKGLPNDFMKVLWFSTSKMSFQDTGYPSYTCNLTCNGAIIECSKGGQVFLPLCAYHRYLYKSLYFLLPNT